MKAVILGSTGQIGRAISNALKAFGVEVIGISRSGTSSNDATHIRMDRSDQCSLAALLETHAPDVVIDMIAMSLQETEPVLEIVASQKVRYIMISSSDVYRQYGLLTKMEFGKPSTAKLAENSPLRTILYPYRDRTSPHPKKTDWTWSYDKIPIEAEVVKLPAWTILRLPMIYGPNDPQQRFRWIFEPAHTNASLLTVPKKWLDWKTTYGFIDNVAATLAKVCVHGGESSEILNVGDYPAMSNRQWVKLCRNLTGWNGDIVSGTANVSKKLRGIERLDLDYHLDVDLRQIKTKYGLSPPHTLEDAFKQTIAGYKQN